jgi:VCBS repeat-containing protein
MVRLAGGYEYRQQGIGAASLIYAEAMNDVPTEGVSPATPPPVPPDGVVSGSFDIRDPNGLPMTYVITHPPALGEVDLYPDGTWTYTPTQAARLSAALAAPGTETRDTFSIEALDADGQAGGGGDILTVAPATLALTHNLYWYQPQWTGSPPVWTMAPNSGNEIGTGWDSLRQLAVSGLDDPARGLHPTLVGIDPEGQLRWFSYTGSGSGSGEDWVPTPATHQRELVNTRSVVTARHAGGGESHLVTTVTSARAVGVRANCVVKVDVALFSNQTPPALPSTSRIE